MNSFWCEFCGGAGVVNLAEGDTGGEAFIPLHPSKRMRSAGILADVAGRFGYKLESFADGGIRAALSAGRGVEGNKYVWGGTGRLVSIALALLLVAADRNGHRGFHETALYDSHGDCR